jgi:chromosomal replication initiator protein
VSIERAGWRIDTTTFGTGNGRIMFKGDNGAGSGFGHGDDRPSAQDETLAKAWRRVKETLRAELGDAVFNSWFGRLEPVAMAGGLVEFSVPTKFLRSWLEAHYGPKILRHMRDEIPAIERLTIGVRTNGAVAPARAAPAERPAAADPAADAPAAAHAPPAARASDGFEGSPLDRRFSLETFLQSRSNAMACAAAMQIVRAAPGEGPIYNPLYLHSAVGLGKTHLAQATALAVEATGRRVIYLTAEKFMYGFVAALKAQTAITFKDRLRGIDMLVIDDVQFLNGKATQQEFCHTLNALVDAGKQVVIAGDRAPTELELLDERVRSRLGGGLVVEIGPLDEELRRKILEARIAVMKQAAPEFDVPAPVLGHIARLIATNGRDLEGAANRLFHLATWSGKPLDIDSAENAVKDLIRNREPKKVKIEEIQRLVANHFNVTRQDILSSRRTATVVLPRQIAMYLSKALTPRSYPEIGRRFGGRDHTTVLHAVRKIEELLQADQSLAGELEHLKRMLQEL